MEREIELISPRQRILSDRHWKNFVTTWNAAQRVIVYGASSITKPEQEKSIKRKIRQAFSEIAVQRTVFPQFSFTCGIERRLGKLGLSEMPF